jgi:hypothetical protein
MAMAITLTTAARNAACNAIVDLIDLGAAANGTIVIYAGGVGGTTLATFTTAGTAFGSASTGAATLASTPLSTTASGTGTANAFQVRDQDAAEVFRGSVTATGGGGDVTIDNTSITSGQTVNLTSFTFTVAA